MVSLNAARDLGPRGDWWATTIAPALGAIAGVYLYDFVLRPFLPKELKPEVEVEKKAVPIPAETKHRHNHSPGPTAVSLAGDHA